MPERGITFFTKVREIKSHVFRIIMISYAYKENAKRAINHAGLFQYIEKSWDNDNLYYKDFRLETS